MKKLVFLLVLFAITTAATAQNYKPFRVDIGIGMSVLGENYNGGFLGHIEPKYAINNHLSVGVRGEMLWTAGKTDIIYIIPSTFVYSLLPSVDYYILPTATFRPFVGAGLGAFIVPGYEAESVSNSGSTSKDVPTRTSFGVMARAGVDVWHLRLSAEYNYAGKDADDFSINYLSIKLVLFIGGGRRS